MELKKNSKPNFNFWKITFINIKIIFYPQDYKKWGKNYFTKNYNFNNWNIKTIINLLPFVFGFSNMIWSRYEDQTISSIFGENIPKTKQIKEELAWETFKFVKSKSINFKNVKQIDLYSNSFIFQFEDQINEKFIGIILPKQKINKFTKKSLIIFESESEVKNLFSQIQKIYSNLDELPKKIEYIEKNQSNFHTEINKNIFKLQLEVLLEKNSKDRNQFNKRFSKITKKYFIPKEFFKFNQNYSIYEKKFSFLGKGVSQYPKTSSFQNNFYPNKEIPFLDHKKIILKNELNLLFYFHGISQNKIKSWDNLNFENFSFLDHCSKETFYILNNYLKIKNQEFNFVRTLSGYKYPDLEKEQIYKIELKKILNKNQRKYFTKIQLPGNFLTFVKENSLINSNSCNELPITSKKDNFMGINSFEEKASEQTSKLLNGKEWKKAVFSETTKPEYNTLDNFDDCDSFSWFFSIPGKDISKGINCEKNYFSEYLEQKVKKNYFYVNNSLFENLQVKYHFPKFTESFLIEKNSNYFKLGNLYKRESSFPTNLKEKNLSFQKNSFSFFESWEPISLNSWMLITQFSIGVFLLNLVKDLYKDYGKELVEYVIQFANSSGIDVEEIKEQYLYDDPSYRLIRKVPKSFKDIAGMDSILLELGEIVWFLRNKGRSVKLKNSLPKGILLTGPPGTGKTLLVQSIAGEAQVPILVESGSLLADPQQKGQGVERLKKIFDQARQLSPCIIFIDEIDTLGEKRQNIIQTPMGSDELIESIYEKSLTNSETEFLQKPLNLEENTTTEKDLEYQLFRGEKEKNLNIGNEKSQQQAETKKTRLSLLTQFLVEIDGLKQRQGVIVIGATNRPNVLDPALIRPGRFDKIINLELPGKQKRIDIFKLYGKKLQVEKKISWEYLAKRTKGFSAADIAAAMNESTIKSIIDKTTHTIETIERGIDLVTSYNFDSRNLKTKTKSTDPFFLSRLAYYQAGKAVLPVFVKNHSSMVVLHLWPRPKNARHKKLYENSFSEITNRKNLEVELIGLYSGKASEMIPLYRNKISNYLKPWQSDLGTEDLISGTFLANLLVDKWYFYSIEVLIRKNNQILNNRNYKEFTELEKKGLSNTLNTENEDELEIEKIAKLSRLGRYQQHGFGPWWQIQVSKQTSEIESFFADWYRIYLPDPEENILNLDWIPPDEYHHSNENIKKFSKKSSTSFNDFYQIERDYVFHGLILNSFNTAFDLLEEKREYLDYFADYLIRFTIIRENEIGFILKKELNQEENQTTLKEKKSNSVQILSPIWGKTSRRKISRFLNLENLSLLEKKSNSKDPFFNLEKD